ncbi:MAG TPA: hypothetical protein VHO94_06420 [Oscillospiraceae bacterium]|nr:hypothetical protein [Oscillospiraceae bacterium]
MKTDFIEIPNLPRGDVAVVVTSGTYPEIVAGLCKMGIEVLQTQPSKQLSTPVCCHADMLCHHLGGNKIMVVKGEIILANELKLHNFIVTEANDYLGSDYPHDILLNAARIGNYLFTNKNLDKSMSEYYKRNSEIKTVFVSQGYTKCSVAVIDGNSIITADKAIAEAARELGLNVLQISPGHIKIEGYDYGFIGGCCGLIGEHKIAFTGDLHTHPDYLQIKNFIKGRNVEIVQLTDKGLIDIGGIIPLKEFV